MKAAKLPPDRLARQALILLRLGRPDLAQILVNENTPRRRKRKRTRTNEP